MKKKTSANLTEVIEQRRQTLSKLRSEGEAYPNEFKRHDAISDIIQRYRDEEQSALHKASVSVYIAGRVMQQRMMGRAGFLDIQDASGRLQIYMRQKEVIFKTTGTFYEVDLGDIVGIKGTVFKTKTGELSVHAMEFHLLVKALRPLPDKFHGLQTVEIRYRRRELDLITNSKTREIFRKRAFLLKTIRAFLEERGYLEVETPMIQPMAGGALARPFVTHHNALNMPLKLRIAPELLLKRLVVGGFEKVYEMNRNFRNEGLSTRHNPEFTMLEFYEAYADCYDAMERTESLLRCVTQAVLGSYHVPYQGEVYDLSRPFERLTVQEALLRYHPTLDAYLINDLSRLRAWARHYPVDANKSLGEIQFSLFEETVEKQLRQPTFITEHPIEVSPLARRKKGHPEVTDRFELYIGGRELANGFSELNDPEDQAERFEVQLKAKAAGSDEAMEYDYDYIESLEYGLPPTAGVGVGIDRLMMLMADVPSIRDVILFPLMRPETCE